MVACCCSRVAGIESIGEGAAGVCVYCCGEDGNGRGSSTAGCATLIEGMVACFCGGFAGVLTICDASPRRAAVAELLVSKALAKEQRASVCIAAERMAMVVGSQASADAATAPLLKVSAGGCQESHRGVALCVAGHPRRSVPVQSRVPHCARDTY